jgi:nucleoside triphosphate pyrophosphatase
MLVLASASPRRQELLRNAGIPFVVEPTSISEIPGEGELPRNFAERMAREKAEAVFRTRSNDFILGADTVVVIDGIILGKPRDAPDAAHMLRLLSGRTHEVITGVCLMGRRLRTEKSQLEAPAGIVDQRRKSRAAPAISESEFRDTRSETTLVTVTELTDEDIHSYIATGEPLDKAGAYGIQGMASRWIPRIEGDYFNVVGLPVALVQRMLHEHDVK